LGSSAAIFNDGGATRYTTISSPSESTDTVSKGTNGMILNAKPLDLAANRSSTDSPRALAHTLRPPFFIEGGFFLSNVPGHRLIPRPERRGFSPLAIRPSAQLGQTATKQRIENPRVGGSILSHQLPCALIHSRASFCASRSCSADILSATIFRSTESWPFDEAMLSHIYAVT
jgi:hypothetical protein